MTTSVSFPKSYCLWFADLFTICYFGCFKKVIGSCLLGYCILCIFSTSVLLPWFRDTDFITVL